MGAPAPRDLVADMVGYLLQRQSSLPDEVARDMREVERHALAAERRRAGIVDRLDRIDERIERLNERVREVRALTETLRTTGYPGREVQIEEVPASVVPPVAPSPPPSNGHVDTFKPGKVLLRVEHLEKEIGGADILTDINFEVYENEILGLIGPNGAGKTTLMECLANLRPRTAGTFYEGDEAPPDWNPRSIMFYLPNGMAPYSELYTIEVLTLFGRIFEVDPKRWESIIVDQLSLVPVLQKKVSALSKGNLQRLLIALALITPQPLLALDEPFDGLDLHQTHAMMDILRDFRAQKRTLLLCIHQLIDAERICDRLLLLSGGRMVGIGTLEQLREQAGLDSECNLEQVFSALTGGRPVARA
jgi:ABC-type multidrug transport system ATPase subunit